MDKLAEYSTITAENDLPPCMAEDNRDFMSDIPSSTFSPLTDLDLEALIDDELDDERRRYVMQEIMNSPQAMDKLEALLTQKRLLNEFWTTFRKNSEH